MTCDAKTVMNKSESCLDINLSTPDCFPHEHNYNTTLGIWALCNSIVGSMGNLFIILSMNYSTRKKLYVVDEYLVRKKYTLSYTYITTPNSKKIFVS